MDLKKICEKKGIDFKILSAKSGISLTYIYELHRGVKENPSIKILKRLSQALEVPISQLLEEPREKVTVN